MSAVLGASLGVAGLRAVSMDLSVSQHLSVSQDLSAEQPHSTESFLQPAQSPEDPWGSVTWSVHRLAREQNASTTAVLALREKDPTEAYGVEYSDGLALVTDIGSQIGALQELGEIVSERTVALFDVGAGGVTVSVVDVESGRVHASRRSAVLSGDACDAAISTFLLGTEPDRSEERTSMIETVCAAKEQLSSVTAVELPGPFPGGSVVLHRSELDSLIRENVRGAVALARSVFADSPRVDALYAVGGGANMQIVRQILFDTIEVPIFVPRRPEMLAARGAVGLARGFAAVPAAGHPRGSSDRPRHSDTSSRRITRLRRSRYLGGAVIAMAAGGVAGAAGTTSNGPDASPVVEFTPVITVSEVETSPALPPAAPSSDAVSVTPTVLPSSPVSDIPAAPSYRESSTERDEPTVDVTTTVRRQRETSTPTTTSSPETTTRETRTRESDPVTTTPPTTTKTTTATTAAPITTRRR